MCEDEGMGLILKTMRLWEEDLGVQTAGLRLLWFISRHTGFIFTCGEFLRQNGIDQLVRCIRVLQVRFVCVCVRERDV